jgi:hypothetical protein
VLEKHQLKTLSDAVSEAWKNVNFAKMKPVQAAAPVVPENSIRGDSRGKAESAHHPMRCLRSSTCLQHL